MMQKSNDPANVYLVDALIFKNVTVAEPRKLKSWINLVITFDTVVPAMQRVGISG